MCVPTLVQAAHLVKRLLIIALAHSRVSENLPVVQERMSSALMQLMPLH